MLRTQLRHASAPCNRRRRRADARAAARVPRPDRSAAPAARVALQSRRHHGQAARARGRSRSYPTATSSSPSGAAFCARSRRTAQVSDPISGVPPVKVVAAQSFHDVVLDPNFATNRYVYFTYFAPPKGEAAREWPIEHYYNEVWNKTLARAPRARLGTRARQPRQALRRQSPPRGARGAHRRPRRAAHRVRAATARCT